MSSELQSALWILAVPSGLYKLSPIVRFPGPEHVKKTSRILVTLYLFPGVFVVIYFVLNCF